MNKIPNCLGVDVGSRRIGLATHPPQMRQAMPFETVEARDRRAAAARIMEVCLARQIEVLVVGWPVDMDGIARSATERVERFLAGVQRAFERAELSAPRVVRWDERLTTTSAEAFLVRADVSRARRKQVVDQIAAAHLLDGYLSSL